MAGVEVFATLKRWFQHRSYYQPVAEISAAGLLLPGRHALWEFFDDFNGFTLGASGVSGWHLDEDGSSTAAAIQDMANGVVMFKTGGTATNNAHYAWANNTTVSEVWKPAAGKRFWMASRFKIEDADQNLPRIGAHITQDDPWNTEPSDQALWRTLAADADALQFAIGKTNSTEVTVALGDLADDTWVRVLAYYDGVDKVHCYRWDDSMNLHTYASGTVTSSSAGDLLPDTEMAPAFGNEAVDTGADDIHIDYIYIAQER